MARYLSDGHALRAVANRYLRACFERQTPPRASELAENLGIGAHQLTRAFRQLLQTTPSAYLKTAQVARAKFLLATSTLSINEVGYASAFGTRMSFFRTFRRAAGVTPARFRTQGMLLDMYGNQSVPSAARKSSLTETHTPADDDNRQHRN